MNKIQKSSEIGLVRKMKSGDYHAKSYLTNGYLIRVVMFICDIDGCIFDNTHRVDLIPTNKHSSAAWSDFNKACANDSPITPRINFVKHHAKMLNDEQYRKITFITARGENARAETLEQLQQYFFNFKFELIMRPMDDNRSTVDYKRDAFYQLSDGMNERSLIIDDNPEIIKMISIHFPQVNRLLVESFDCTLSGNDREVHV